MTLESAIHCLAIIYAIIGYYHIPKALCTSASDNSLIHVCLVMIGTIIIWPILWIAGPEDSD